MHFSPEADTSSLTFDALGLPDSLLQATKDMGFTHPTPIQAGAIPFLLSGRDVLGVAQTGTGKTAAFGIPLLAHVDPEVPHVQAIVLAPTRELAMQGARALEDFASHVHRLEVVAVYGGSSYTPQLRALERGAQVVVGTPGRIIDLMERGALELSHVRYFVLDEADEMLRMGFAEAVEQIAEQVVDHDHVSALFSATMPPAIRRIAETYLHDAEEVTIAPPATTVETVHQTFAIVPERHKIGALARVLAVSEADAALVFVRTRATAENLAVELSIRGVATSALSGDVAQKDRERLVSRLREGTLDVLVATDVAARGLDVERIGLVVNFDVPRETDTYVHRIGRTGRAGRAGEALTFVTPRERARLRRIEKATHSRLEEVELPSPAEVSKYRGMKLVEEARKRFTAGRLDVYREILEAFDRSVADDGARSSMSEDGTEGLESVAGQATKPQVASREDLLLALLALGVRDPGPNPEDEVEEKKSASHKKSRLPHPVRYRVEVGKKDRVRPGAIVGAITNVGGLKGSDLGHIDIFPTFSLVEIGVPLSPEAREAISAAKVSGRALRISEDRFQDRPSSRERDASRDRGVTDKRVAESDSEHADALSGAEAGPGASVERTYHRDTERDVTSRRAYKDPKSDRREREARRFERRNKESRDFGRRAGRSDRYDRSESYGKSRRAGSWDRSERGRNFDRYGSGERFSDRGSYGRGDRKSRQSDDHYGRERYSRDRNGKRGQFDRSGWASSKSRTFSNKKRRFK